MTFSSRPRLIKLAILDYLLYLISILISYINCKYYVLYKMIFSDKFDLFWTSLSLYIGGKEKISADLES